MDNKTSVVLAAYNDEKYIGEQLDSLFKQIRVTDEILTGDDSEDDVTARVVELARSHYHGNLRYICNPKQLGVTFALSEAKICPDIFQGCNYWKLFRNNHSGTPVKYTREQTFLRLLKSYYCVARLKLLFARYGIKNFDWRKNEIQ